MAKPIDAYGILGGMPSFKAMVVVVPNTDTDVAQRFFEVKYS